MIQRIQTVYFSLVVIFSILIFFFPVYEIENDSSKFLLDEFTSKNPSSFIFPILILDLLSGTLAAISLFLYKRRTLQIKLTQVNLLLIVLLILAFFVYIDKQVFENVYIEYGAATYFPLVMLLFVFLANRAIRKDEELVRSADRIR